MKRVGASPDGRAGTYFLGKMPVWLKGALSAIPRHWPSHSQPKVLASRTSLQPWQHFPILSQAKKMLCYALYKHKAQRCAAICTSCCGGLFVGAPDQLLLCVVNPYGFQPFTRPSGVKKKRAT